MLKYLHFTDLNGAKGIQDTGEIWSSSFGAQGVFGAVEGGSWVPGVQMTSMGRAIDRSIIVVFTTKLLPDVAHPEEVIWHLKSLPVKVESIIKPDVAKTLLNGQISEDKETNMLSIPLHPAVNSWKGWVRLPENLSPWVPGVNSEKWILANKIFRDTENIDKVVEFWKSDYK